MLRRSLIALSFNNNANTAAVAPSPHRKRGSIAKARRASLVSNKIPVQTTIRQSGSGGFLPSDGRNSLKITISPERIEAVCEYVKFFCPGDSDHLINVADIEKLFLQPRFSKDSLTSPELVQQEMTLHTMDHFLKLLQAAQMDYCEWFDFVLSRSGNNSSETLSIGDFCSEINRLSKDLRQPGFIPEQLRELYLSIIHNEDASNRMDRAQLDHAIKTFSIKEQQFRLINTTATELQSVSLYMRRKFISLKSILEVTEPELKNEQIHISQLTLLISSLLLMYEMYVSEYGIPVAEMSPCTPPSSEKAFSFDAFSNPISEITVPSNLQTHRSTSGDEGGDLSGTNTNKQKSLNRSSSLKRSGSAKSGENSSNSPLSKVLSFKVQVPSEIVTTVGNVLTTIRKSLSFKTKNAPILPEEGGGGEPEMKSNQEPLRSSINRNSMTRISNSLPVEVNSEFVKHLDWEERTKVLLLVRAMREGDSTKASQQKNDASPNKDEKMVNVLSRYSVVRSTKSNKSSRIPNFNSTSASMKSFASGKNNFGNENYIILNTDDGDYDDLLFESEPQQPMSPKVNEVNPLNSRRRSVINTSVNRVENLKNDVLESFNRRIGQASLLMKQNR